MSSYSALSILVLALFLSGCDESLEVSIHSTDRPYLNEFHIVDSYGVNTEYDGHIPLAISPFIDHGFFELFWDVDSYHSYEVNFLINDHASINNALLVTSDICGLGYNCDNFAYQHCFYHADLTISCEQPDSPVLGKRVDISELFQYIPDKLYFILEVCDRDYHYCESDSRAVWLE